MGADAAATARLVAAKAAELTAADAAVLLAPADDGFVVRAVHGGPEAEELEYAGRGYGWADEDLASGDVEAALAQPGALEPALGGASLLDGERPTAVVPLTAGDELVGVLVVVREPAAPAFAEDDRRLVASFADHAALAVEFSRASADRQRLAVLEDRTRIAEDLHDLVIQRLFAVGLGLQGLSARVDSDQARERLSAFIDDLDGTIRAIRQTIFSLQEPEDHATGLRGEALRVVAEAVPALGFEPELTFEGPLDSTVPEKSAPEVLAVLREALSNVARHAQASHAQVSLTADPSRWTLRLLVEDDGVGPGPDDVPGLGTATMAARARRLGGGCSLERREAGGARLRWWASLDEPR